MDTKSIPLVGKQRSALRLLTARLSPLLLIVITTIALFVLLFPYTSTVQSIDLLKEGEVARETIIAPFTFDILKSTPELDAERSEARNRILQVVEYDQTIAKGVREHIRTFQKNLLLLVDAKTPDSLKALSRSAVKKAVSDNSIDILSRNMYLMDDALMLSEQMLNKGICEVLLIGSSQQLAEVRTRFNKSFERFLLYDKPYVTLLDDSLESTVNVELLMVKEVALESALRKLRQQRSFSAAQLNSIYELLYAFVVPNVRLNQNETQRRRELAEQEVLPIKGKVIKDTEIVRKHQEVTTEVVDKIRSLRSAIASLHPGEQTQRLILSNGARVLLSLIPLLFMLFYIKRFHPALVADSKHLSAFFCIIIMQVALIRAAMVVVPRLFAGTSEWTQVVPDYLIPVTIAAMLVTILFNAQLGMVVSLCISIFFGIVHGFSLPLVMFSLFGGIVASLATRNIRYRWDFFRAIPPLFALFAILIVLLQLSAYRVEPLALVQNVGLAMINAITATFLAMMATTVFENLFDITTNMTLVELSDMNNPVLKRLSIEAAGTYNHSVLVANLAESAAERIGANALLARVASYYHDIGKLSKVEYYIENCINNDRNKHNKLSPSMSSLIISSHVKEGMELAKKHKLPKLIKDAILQHHGNSLVSFFYEKAREQDPHNQVQEKDYRYPGPRPQTRENAIIMLADSVEAASRSLATSSPKLLRELVKKIIRDKFMSSQLDQCDLTLRDLDEIVEGFMPVLQGIFHTRIEYPSK